MKKKKYKCKTCKHKNTNNVLGYICSHPHRPRSIFRIAEFVAKDDKPLDCPRDEE
jgi:hypothetical protein